MFPVNQVDTVQSSKECLMHLLVIEDYEGLNRLIKKKIVIAGFKFDVGFSGADAITLVQKSKDVLLLLDFVLPDMNGREIIESIKKQKLDVPFIVMTGHGDEKTAVEMMKLGARDYLIKDAIFTERLIPVVQRVCTEVSTEKKLSHAENSLMAAAHEWQTTFDTINDSVALLDPDTRVIRCNRAMRDMLGKPWKEIIGQSCCLLMHGSISPINDCPYQRVFKSKQRESEIISVGDKLFDVTVYPVFDDNGEISKAVHVFSDITQLKKSENELRMFRELVDQSNDAFFVVEPETSRILDVNRKACDETGYSRNELLQLHVLDIDPSLTTLSDWYDLSSVINAKGPQVFIRDMRHTDGSIHPVEVSVKLIQYHEKEYFVAVARDITERMQKDAALRNNEKMFRDLYEQAPVAYFSISAEDESILMCNQQASNLLGYSQESLLQMTVFGLYVDGPSGVELARKVYKKFKAGIVTIDEELLMQHQDGSTLWISLSVYPMYDDSGNIIESRSVVIDVSERKRLTETLIRTQKMESIGTLVGGIAHDFNNILSVILGFGGLILDEVDSDDSHYQDVSEIIGAAERAVHLTRGLLTFSRKQITELTTVNINDVFMGIEKILSRIIGEDIKVERQYDKSELVVMADPTQIEQVLMNLAANARDAMPDGGTLTIKISSVDIDMEIVGFHGYIASGSYALISFSDTGIGMNEGTKQKIFDPFFTTKETGKGTGLGLAIIYGIVKEHKGYIDCISELGEGTTFDIYLPLLGMDLLKPEATTGQEELKPGSETILLVEDDTSLRVLGRRILEKQGYTVFEAVDGVDAVEKFKSNIDSIEMVISDVVMPRMSGIEAWEKIIKINSDVKYLFLTGYPTEVAQKKGLFDAGVHFLYKPFASKVLLKTVKEILDIGRVKNNK